MRFLLAQTSCALQAQHDYQYKSVQFVLIHRYICSLRSLTTGHIELPELASNQHAKNERSSTTLNAQLTHEHFRAQRSNIGCSKGRPQPRPAKHIVGFHREFSGLSQSRFEKFGRGWTTANSGQGAFDAVPRRGRLQRASKGPPAMVVSSNGVA